MSDAKRCDRCNKFYSIDDENEERGEYHPISISYKKQVYSMALYDKNVNRIEHFEFCPECSRSLIVWLDLCDICKYKDVLVFNNPCRSCGSFNNFEPKEDSE